MLIPTLILYTIKSLEYCHHKTCCFIKFSFKSKVFSSCLSGTSLSKNSANVVTFLLYLSQKWLKVSPAKQKNIPGKLPFVLREFIPLSLCRRKTNVKLTSFYLGTLIFSMVRKEFSKSASWKSVIVGKRLNQNQVN